ncbi:MAG: 3-phenylpropionate/cinnamic acid dioxygenase subunit beta [Acidobacteria bacterium]|nr:MAG: 3-phenylpropionate/cinnamic acid dioxygenase subunit beta [Acidobacteriota bacterium]
MIEVNEQVYREVRDFLLREAELLDNGAYRDWLGCLTEDIRYQVPVRVTRDRGVESEFVSEMGHLDEDHVSLEMRIMRLETEYAWAEDPPSRTRHFVSNIRVEPGDRDDEVKVKSNLLLYRTRGDDPHYDLLSAERHDVLRRINSQWKLARRLVLLDQTTIGTHNLSILF